MRGTTSSQNLRLSSASRSRRLLPSPTNTLSLGKGRRSASARLRMGSPLEKLTLRRKERQEWILRWQAFSPSWRISSTWLRSRSLGERCGRLRSGLRQRSFFRKKTGCGFSLIEQMVITSSILGLVAAIRDSISSILSRMEHFSRAPASSRPGLRDFCLVMSALRSFLGKALVEYLAQGLTCSQLRSSSAWISRLSSSGSRLTKARRSSRKWLSSCWMMWSRRFSKLRCCSMRSRASLTRSAAGLPPRAARCAELSPRCWRASSLGRKALRVSRLTLRSWLASSRLVNMKAGTSKTRALVRVVESVDSQTFCRLRALARSISSPPVLFCIIRLLRWFIPNQSPFPLLKYSPFALLTSHGCALLPWILSN